MRALVVTAGAILFALWLAVFILLLWMAVSVVAVFWGLG